MDRTCGRGLQRFMPPSYASKLLERVVVQKGRKALVPQRSGQTHQDRDGGETAVVLDVVQVLVGDAGGRSQRLLSEPQPFSPSAHVLRDRDAQFRIREVHVSFVWSPLLSRCGPA